MWIGSAPIYTRTVGKVGKVGVRFGSVPELQSTTGQDWICQVDKVWVVDRARKTYMFVGFKKSQSSRLFVGLVFFRIGGGVSHRSTGGFCPAGLPPKDPMVTFGEEFDVAKIIPSLQRLQ